MECLLCDVQLLRECRQRGDSAGRVSRRTLCQCPHLWGFFVKGSAMEPSSTSLHTGDDLPH